MNLSCRDLGCPCDFVATGERAREVKRKLLAHTEREHLESVIWMSPREIRRLAATIDAKLAQRYPVLYIVSAGRRAHAVP